MPAEKYLPAGLGRPSCSHCLYWEKVPQLKEGGVGESFIHPPKVYSPVLSLRKGDILIITGLTPVSVLFVSEHPPPFFYGTCFLPVLRPPPKDKAAEALTQARGLFPFDLGELGDGVGPVAVGEDDTQLLADDFVLQRRKDSSPHWGPCTTSSKLLPGTRTPPSRCERSPQTYHRFREKFPWTSHIQPALAGPGVAGSVCPFLTGSLVKD